MQSKQGKQRKKTDRRRLMEKNLVAGRDVQLR